MYDTDASSAPLLRGIQLKNLRRYADAEKSFREALALNANDAFALHHLAVCQFRQPGRCDDALQTMRAAIAADPREPEHFAMEGIILCALNQPKESLDSADRALAIDPYCTLAFACRAQAYLQMEQWANAETAARCALAIDPDDSHAANQLAHALRLQNKESENAVHLAGMLARNPDDAFTHANAGWAALQSGNRKEAETHFREALRLHPDFASARAGLLHSFRARSAFYRAYLDYCFRMQRLTKKYRWAVVIGLWGSVQIGQHALRGPHPAFWLSLVALYFILVLWTWIAKGVGNFILLFDSMVRHALYKSEKYEGIAVGGGLCVGVTLFVLGIALNLLIPVVAGAALVVAAFPFSMTFTNGSRVGSWIFGSIGFGTLAAALFFLLQSVWPIVPVEITTEIFLASLVICLACTWLGNIPALKQ